MVRMPRHSRLRHEVVGKLLAPARLVGVAAALASLSAGHTAAGQPAGGTIEGRAVVVGASEGEQPLESTLRGRFGVPVAKRLLLSSDAADRLRGIERLGAIGTEEAVDALVEAMETGMALGRDPEARVLSVRALAAHAHRAGARGFLTRELSDAGRGKGATVTSLGDLLRDSAALALARSAAHRPGGDDEALAALLVAVRQGGPSADAAARALVVYPPPSIGGILDGFDKPARSGDEEGDGDDDAPDPTEKSESSEKPDPPKGGKPKATESPKKPDAEEGKGAETKPGSTAKKALSPRVIDLLGDLGDLRAIPRLRAELKRKNQAGQISAAIALAKLGDATPAALARTWIKRPDARLQISATEVLVRLGTPDAPRAIATLLSSDATRARGVAFASDAPTPALVKALEAALPRLRVEDRPACVEAIGRAGGAAAVRLLVERLGDPLLATPAAFALAMASGPEARDALAGALAKSNDEGEGARRRLVARAATVRALVWREAPEGLVPVLEAMAASKRPEDRHVAALGLVALGEWETSDVLARNDAPFSRGAAGGVLAGGGGASGFAKLLTADPAAVPPSALTVAAGVALLSDEGLGEVPTSWLLRHAEAGGALSPLAARALAMRDDESLRPQIERLLVGTDPLVRAHVARGLGHSQEHDAVSMLARAYRFEPDPTVRRAIVRGLSDRTEVQRRRTLELARDLDPDAQVRALARSALMGRALNGLVVSAGPYVGWVDLVANAPGAEGLAARRAATVVRGDGVAVPVVSSDDGVLFVPGLGRGRGAVRLAPAAPSGDASAP